MAVTTPSVAAPTKTTGTVCRVAGCRDTLWPTWERWYRHYLMAHYRPSHSPAPAVEP